MFVWTSVLVGNLPHSRFREVQLKSSSGDDFQVPGEGPVEVREKGILALNNVTRTGGLRTVWRTRKRFKLIKRSNNYTTFETYILDLHTNFSVDLHTENILRSRTGKL